MNTLHLAQYSETPRAAEWRHEQGTLTLKRLADQNQHFEGTAGVSHENRSLGFLPAFADTDTGMVYLSRFANGQLAPMHLLDGLPEKVVEQRDACGRVMAVKDSVIAGFVRDDYFYTREQAAQFATKH